jgi:Flp pilus assembly protein TadD
MALVSHALKKKDYATVDRVLTEGLAVAPDSPQTMNALAWVRATCPDEKRRNGQEAVRLAQKASDATRNSSFEYVDTLACALAEAGRFEEAEKKAGEAADLARRAGQQNIANEYEERRAMFKRKEPYRDTN